MLIWPVVEIARPEMAVRSGPEPAGERLGSSPSSEIRTITYDPLLAVCLCESFEEKS